MQPGLWVHKSRKRGPSGQRGARATWRVILVPQSTYNNLGRKQGRSFKPAAWTTENSARAQSCTVSMRIPVSPVQIMPFMDACKKPPAGGPLDVDNTESSEGAKPHYPSACPLRDINAVTPSGGEITAVTKILVVAGSPGHTTVHQSMGWQSGTSVASASSLAATRPPLHNLRSHAHALLPVSLRKRCTACLASTCRFTA